MSTDKTPMNVIKLAPDLELYSIPPDQGSFTTCMLLLHNGSEVLMIDSGYERHSEQLGTGDNLRFGSFRLEFFLTPGHSEHHLITRLDDDLLHVGDLLIHTADGRPTPPYLGHADAVKDHLASLDLILDLAPARVVCGHGLVLTGMKQIAAEVERRRFYLRRLAAARAPIALADCLDEAVDGWSRHDFHHLNLRTLKLLAS